MTTAENRRLMVAAPELLEACRLALVALQRRSTQLQRANAIQALRKALAMATGERA